jgi:hypothetical protein
MWDLVKGRCTYTSKLEAEAEAVAFSQEDGGARYALLAGSSLTLHSVAGEAGGPCLRALPCWLPGGAACLPACLPARLGGYILHGADACLLARPGRHAHYLGMPSWLTCSALLCCPPAGLLHTLVHPRRALCMAWAPGNRIVSGSEDGSLRLWDAQVRLPACLLLACLPACLPWLPGWLPWPARLAALACAAARLQILLPPPCIRCPAPAALAPAALPALHCTPTLASPDERNTNHTFNT